MSHQKKHHHDLTIPMTLAVRKFLNSTQGVRLMILAFEFGSSRGHAYNMQLQLWYTSHLQRYFLGHNSSEHPPGGPTNQTVSTILYTWFAKHLHMFSKLAAIFRVIWLLPYPTEYFVYIPISLTCKGIFMFPPRLSLFCKCSFSETFPTISSEKSKLKHSTGCSCWNACKCLFKSGPVFEVSGISWTEAPPECSSRKNAHPVRAHSQKFSLVFSRK